MRILELSPSLAPGGAERFTVDLSNELSKTNDVTLLVMRKFRNSNFYQKELSKNIRYIQCNGSQSKISKLLQCLQVFYWILKLKPDIVHAHTIGINWLVLPSVFIRKPKYFFTVHNLADQECTTRLGYRIRNFLFKRNVRAVTISDKCEKSFKKFFGYSSFRQIENGCRDIKVTSKLMEVKAEISQYKKSSNTKVYVNVSRVMPQKNHQLLIKTFNKFLDMGYDAILLIIGDYKVFPGAKEELDSLIKSDGIYFLGEKNNIPDYLDSADYFCLSSLWEGLPISLLEAGLSGCYPISTPAGGVVDVITDLQWGILSKDFSEDEYLHAMEIAYKTDYDRHELKELYYKKYSMDICAQKYNISFNIQ